MRQVCGMGDEGRSDVLEVPARKDRCRAEFGRVLHRVRTQSEPGNDGYKRSGRIVSQAGIGGKRIPQSQDGATGGSPDLPQERRADSGSCFFMHVGLLCAVAYDKTPATDFSTKTGKARTVNGLSEM